MNNIRMSFSVNSTFYVFNKIKYMCSKERNDRPGQIPNLVRSVELQLSPFIMKLP